MEHRMEGLTRLVSDSLTRHGIETALDYRRLQWSKWFHCESSVSFVLAPSKPGIFSSAEEVAPAGGLAATDGKRMLALVRDRKSTRLNSSHDQISYAVFCLKKKKTK